MAQGSVSDAESISGEEIREPRRRNSPSDSSSRDIEDHVLIGHESFRSWCAACAQERRRAERHQSEGCKELSDGSEIPVLSLDVCSTGPGIESVRLSLNNVVTVLLW